MFFLKVLAVTLDTTELVNAINGVVQLILDNAPLGILIFGSIAAIVGGLMFGQKLIGVVMKAFSSFGGSGR